MIYLLHGEEEFLRAEALARIKAGLGDPEMASLNTLWLDGRKASMADVQTACDALPFLSERRLVVVEGLLARLLSRKREAGDEADGSQGEDEAKPAGPLLQGLTAYLERVPATTDLVLDEPQEISKAQPVFKTLMKLVQEGRAEVITCPPIKKQDELSGWIMDRAKAKGARLTFDAAEELAAFVGSQLRLLDQELDKLMAYAPDRTITPADVRLLVPATREANIFEMVEALGRGDGKLAVRTLRELLDDGQPPLGILGMVARQVRLLLQAKELTARGLPAPDVARALRLQGWQSDRIVRQAGRYTFPQLERMHDRLLETDVAIKTGQMDDDMAVEMLVISLSR
ncbi:MAG: DNA polymerase III subunit delta [Anaerolineae bacterium]|nr:DNA polymerase III subunit delta [Anaerolineae bacterium]